MINIRRNIFAIPLLLKQIVHTFAYFLDSRTIDI